MTAHRRVEIVDTMPASGTLPGAAMPSTTRIGAIMLGQDENTLLPAFVRVTSGGSVRAQVTMSGFTSTNRSAGALEGQKGISFGSGLGIVRIFVDPTAATLVTLPNGRLIAAWLLFVNKGSAAINGDVPFGAHVYGLEAGESAMFHSQTFAEAFSGGVRAVLSTTYLTVTLGPTGLFTVLALP